MAFATILVPGVPKAARAVMLVVQGLTILAMAATLIILLSIAEAGTMGWNGMWWFWLGVVVAFFAAVHAVREGYRVYRHAYTLYSSSSRFHSSLHPWLAHRIA